MSAFDSISSPAFPKLFSVPCNAFCAGHLESFLFVAAILEYSQTSSDSPSSVKEVAFVLDNVADWQTLAAGVRPGVEVVVLDATGDGLAQMAAWVQGKSGYDAIHVLSHGNVGAVTLGTLNLDHSAVLKRSGDLASLGRALTADGDLLF
jgi:hypothetical protein